jgi:predicted nucleic acid-binding protein
MGTKYLIDANAIIDYYGKRLPPEGVAFIERIDSPFISVITQMELLGTQYF